MRVLTVVPSFFPATINGGPTYPILHMGRVLCQLGVDFRVSTTDSNGEERLNVPTNRFVEDVTGFPTKYNKETIIGKLSVAMIISLFRDIRNSNVIHVNATFSTSVPVALLYGVLNRKRVILSPRGALGIWCLNKRKLMKLIWLNVFIRPFANKIIWHATATQEMHEIKAIFPKADVRVLPNPILLEEYLTNTDDFDYFQEKHGIEKGSCRIISMGRLSHKKGFDILISSFVRLLETRPDAHLFIAGSDFGAKKELRSQVKKTGVNDRIFFCGELEGRDKVSFFQNGNLFVLPSHNENFGNVYLEALASGTPIVASTNTPWQDVEHAGCGAWVDNSTREVSDAMTRVLHVPRDEIKLKSRAFARSFSAFEVSKKYLSLYQNG